MRIKVHEHINPNRIFEWYYNATFEQKQFIYEFVDNEKLWCEALAREHDTKPWMFKWSPVVGVGTDIDVCEVTGMNCMCDEWELKQL